MSKLLQFPDDTTYSAHEQQYVPIWSLNMYRTINEKTKNGIPFNFLDGPPFVSGALHHGHILVGTIKSIVYNYHSMCGLKCENVQGYDCHGLPIENLVCKEYKLDTLEKINELGLFNFNKLCDDMITKYSDPTHTTTSSESWKGSYDRMARFTDHQKTYKTRDLNYMNTVMWMFKELYDKNLVYSGNKVMPYSYANRTPLSISEASSNYQEKESKSIYVMFEVDSKEVGEYKEYFVAWTTTPWTLVANLALCVNAKLDYVKILFENKILILSKKSIGNLLNKKQKYTTILECKGSDLVGLRYIPIYPYMQAVDNAKGFIRNYIVLSDPYVTDGVDGTAIVHMAPVFGEDDMRVCSANNLIDNRNSADYCPIDSSGQYTADIDLYAGRLVFDCDTDICQYLKNRELLLKLQLYRHNYPYCWRTDTPLIYKTTKSLYVDVSKLKDRMIELNKTVTWIPADVGATRFHNWLKDARDWAISRPRYYGTPIPLWVSENGSVICIGSTAELEELTGTKITNLHPEYLNDLIIVKNNMTYRRIPEVFDCWFESGAAFAAPFHYPFNPDSKQLEEREFLSDFICEGVDQTRGWFYTLMVLCTAIFNKAPYRTVMCTGMVLDAKGKKFSKKLGNFINPMVDIDKYGADTVRTYFASSPAAHGDSLKFDTGSIDGLKKRFIPYINGVKFWIEHAMNYSKKYELDDLKIPEIIESNNLMDCWIIDRTNQLTNQTNIAMSGYNFSSAINTMLDYFDDLTNWYIKFNRHRIKGLGGQEEWKQSIQTLYNVLIIVCRLWAPITPFLSEHIYQHLRMCSDKYCQIDSVFLTDYPTSNIDNTPTLQIFKDLQRIVVMVRTMRDRTKYHARPAIPIKTCTIYHNDEKYLDDLKQSLPAVYSELNCQTFVFEKLSDNSTIRITPNKKEIGQTYRKDAQSITRLIESLTEEELRVQFESKYYTVSRIPRTALESEHIGSMIDWDLMVSIDQYYYPDIHYTYQIKRMRSVVQQIRKKLNLRPWNKIDVMTNIKIADSNVVQSLQELLPDVQVSVIDTVDTMTNLYIEDFQWDGYAINAEPSVHGKIAVIYQ